MRRQRGEGGFTMVELTLTIAILGVITLPLGNLLLGYFQSTVATQSRLAESHDAQLAAAWFGQDVASMGRRDTNDDLLPSLWAGSSVAAPYTCGTTSGVLTIAWDEYADPSTKSVREVTWWTRSSGGERQLVRTSCTGTAASATTVVVAHDVDPAAAPTVTCTPSCTVAAPASVRLELSVKDGGNRGAAYLLTLRGDRRQS